MISIHQRDGKLYVDGRVYSSVLELLDSYNVRPNIALEMLESGITLNEILDRKKITTHLKAGHAALEVVLKKSHSQHMNIIYEDFVCSKSANNFKFNELKKNNKFITNELNTLHKICDKTAQSDAAIAKCVVFNTLSRLHDDISKACLSRWQKLSKRKTVSVCSIEEIISGGLFDSISIDVDKLENFRQCDFLIIKQHSKGIAENTKTSLGILLRQRANQGKSTLLLTTSEFYFAMLDYPTFLRESFFEYGNYLHVIDANPSMSL